jgi:hypothetical protein
LSLRCLFGRQFQQRWSRLLRCLSTAAESVFDNDDFQPQTLPPQAQSAAFLIHWLFRLRKRRRR